jgi:hypothetical protein
MLQCQYLLLRFISSGFCRANGFSHNSSKTFLGNRRGGSGQQSRQGTAVRGEGVHSSASGSAASNLPQPDCSFLLSQHYLQLIKAPPVLRGNGVSQDM